MDQKIRNGKAVSLALIYSVWLEPGLELTM
jgi:hypothetical protein